jgi:hypothetical protein
MRIRAIDAAAGCLALLLFLPMPAAWAAEPRVELEVVLETGFIPTDAPKWSQMLDEAGFSSVRIRSGKNNESPAIQASGTGGAKTYRVVGILSANNQLLLTKGRFGLNDRAKIEEWLRKLRTDGEEGVTIKPAAFGLLPRQLLEVHEALAVPVKVSTKGKQPRDVAKQIASGLSLKFTTDSAGQKALAADEPILDELEGLSSGTALAAVLRPLGLVLVPEKSGSEIRLRISSGQAVSEHWPVGWPPKDNPTETLPGLFKNLKVAIDKTPVGEVITAVSDRLKVPVLLDHNSLAAAQIDLATAAVSLPETTTYYDRILDRLLFQAKLKYQLRVDEAGKPFLWITTIRQ